MDACADERESDFLPKAQTAQATSSVGANAIAIVIVIGIAITIAISFAQVFGKGKTQFVICFFNLNIKMFSQ